MTRTVVARNIEDGAVRLLPLSMRIITHNIRYATETPFKGEERWTIRCPRICTQLAFNAVGPETFICLQEALHHQLVDVVDALNVAQPPQPGWSYIGVGRDDGRKGGEYSPIIYRPSIWHLTAWNTRWLSTTPDKPSYGWDAANIRLVTIGRFTHIKTGKKVVICCTHFDHVGTKARRESAKLILQEIQAVTAQSEASAVILAGDFNSTPDDDAYKTMTATDSVMEDISSKVPAAKRYGNELTFTSFGYVDNQAVRIDFVFARKSDDLHYQSFGVLANRFDDGVYLSDHRACVADVVLKS